MYSHIFRSKHKVYAELFAALDEFEEGESTAFKIGEEHLSGGAPTAHAH